MSSNEVSKSKLLLGNPEYFDKTYYNQALKSNNLDGLDYHLARTFHNPENSRRLVGRSVIENSNMQYRDSFKEIDDGYNVSLLSEDEQLTLMIDEVLIFSLNYLTDIKDKFRILNYLAYILVREELNQHYKGENTALLLLCGELLEKKHGKLTFSTFSDLISRHDIKKAEGVFFNLIGTMQNSLWKNYL